MKTPNKRAGRCSPEGCCGTLPECAPLAVPYIPWQPENPPQYEAQKGFVRGTMFPGLDLPGIGKANTELQPDTLRTQLQAVHFAILELSLYLDTHREDEEALELYRGYQKVQKELQARWTAQYGPINHQEPGEGPYAWVDDPWPWEYCANREE